MKTLHINIGTKTGGAERMLQRLVVCQSSEAHEHIVLSMCEIGPIGHSLQEQGIRVETLGMKQGEISIRAIFKLCRVVRLIKPDVVMGWMYHGAAAALLAKLCCRRIRMVIWNIRHSLDSLENETSTTRRLIKLLKLLSVVPDHIVYNSNRSLRQHLALGFRSCTATVIPNGFDSNEFFPDDSISADVRAELDIPRDGFVVGHVARYHWIKGSVCFLSVVQRVTDMSDNIYFVWLGRGAEWDNPQLQADLPELHNPSQLCLLGERSDVARLYKGFDALILTSVSEGFPNVLGEAMLTGLYCVTTDVGDAVEIVGEFGASCDVGDIDALSNSILQAAKTLGNPDRKAEHSRRARSRIQETFSIEAVLQRYEALYDRAS